VVPQFARAELLAGLKSVSFCCIFTESDPRRVLSIVRPDILVKGSEYTLRAVVGGASVRRRGGKVVRVPLVEGISTTTTIHGISSRTGRARAGDSPPARRNRA
jgi:D-beta-D-heptose 7-phosphate kinase/D-beta-D-heptose 1-phosphate adenosyltransferase